MPTFCHHLGQASPSQAQMLLLLLPAPLYQLGGQYPGQGSDLQWVRGSGRVEVLTWGPVSPICGPQLHWSPDCCCLWTWLGWTLTICHHRPCWLQGQELPWLASKVTSQGWPGVQGTSLRFYPPTVTCGGRTAQQALPTTMLDSTHLGSLCRHMNEVVPPRFLKGQHFLMDYEPLK